MSVTGLHGGFTRWLLERLLAYSLLLCILLFYRGKQNDDDDHLALDSSQTCLYRAKCFVLINDSPCVHCYTVGLSKERKVVLDWYELLCFGSPSIIHFVPGDRIMQRAYYCRELIFLWLTGCVRDSHGPLLHPGYPIFPGDHLTRSKKRTDILPCAFLGATW